MTKLRISKRVLLLIGLGACSLAALVWVNWPATDYLSVTFLDVGQGDSVLVRTPGGETILIDGGSNASVLDGLGKHLPITERTIDLMVLTHPHADHFIGLMSVLERYKVKWVLYSGEAPDSTQFVEWQRLVGKQNIPMTRAQAGQVFSYDEVMFTVLYPLVPGEYASDNLNDTSVVARLTYHNTSFLLTGDATSTVEPLLTEQYGTTLASDVLKVGHHGSRYSTSLTFLDVVRPEYAVIQVGEGNSYGHPHRQTLVRLQQVGIKVFRTDRDGDIELKSNGNQVWAGPLDK